MKALFVFVSLVLSAASAQAVVTAHCPQIIQMEISDYQSFDWDTPSSITFESTLELTSTENSNCYYRNVEGEGVVSYARIQGSLKPGAKESAYLVAYYNFGGGDFAAYMDVETMTESSIEISSEARVYIATKFCYYGCAPLHEAVGTADFMFVADY